MSKRTFLAGAVMTLTALTGSMLHAQDKTATFFMNSGSPVYIPASSMDNASFGSGAISFSLKNGQKASFATASLDSICFVRQSMSASVIPSAVKSVEQAFSSSSAPACSQTDEPAAGSFRETDEQYNDYFENYAPENFVTITYSGNSVTVSGTPKNVTITKNGAHVTVSSTKGHVQYTLKGSTTNGSFNMTDRGEESKKCHIRLNGVSIENPNGPAINIQSHKAVYLSLGKETSNTLKDGAVYQQVADEQRKGTIFSEGQLIISGTGSLSVTAKGGHGICSDDYIRLRQDVGSISITAASDGINTKERFVMYGGNVSISSQDDGVQIRQGHIEQYGGQLKVKCVDDGLSAGNENADSAYISLNGGLINIETSGQKGHGISAYGNISIDKGTCILAKSTGLGSKCIKTDSNLTIGKSDIYAWNTAQNLSETDDSAKARGLSAAGSMSIGRNANVNVLAAKTALHAGSKLTFDGGSALLSAQDLDKCLNAKGSLTFNSGYAISDITK